MHNISIPVRWRAHIWQQLQYVCAVNLCAHIVACTVDKAKTQAMEPNADRARVEVSRPQTQYDNNILLQCHYRIKCISIECTREDLFISAIAI